ncbi:hypothetical protein PV08_09048 [Exophiala spinifera]|uniref:Uncharacterized protein n=1 Tax=Exophiala spinifera TaxID=91928 RepID=A0A0D1Y9Y9_9EURO|nr:uncharacterized protein PV08_09048 [Exophiala spinifera]KIW11776.1 hypothetical protein PV08_09048 [Exophiala spinifera]
MAHNMDQPSPFRYHAFFSQPRPDQGALSATDDEDVHMNDMPQTINPYQMDLTPPVVWTDEIPHSILSIAQGPLVQPNAINTQHSLLPHPIYYQNMITTPGMPEMQFYPHSPIQHPILNGNFAGTQAIRTPTMEHLLPLQPPASLMHPSQNALARRTIMPMPPAQQLQAQGQQQQTAAPGHRLDNLPAEIRLEIYGYLFQGAEIEVIPRNMTRCRPDVPASPCKVIEGAHTNIIRTSKFFFLDALPTLAKATHLNIPQPYHPQEATEDPLRQFPESFLKRIETITGDFNAFGRINGQRLRRLKHANLFHEVDSAGGFVDTVHIINCENCGGVDAVINAAFEGVVNNWRWLQKQIARNARREGFTVDMTVTWEVYCEAPGMAKFEFKMNCATNKVVRTKAFIGGQEVGTNSETQAAADWDALSGM